MLRRAKSKLKPCKTCNGKGVVDQPVNDKNVSLKTCPACGGTGRAKRITKRQSDSEAMALAKAKRQRIRERNLRIVAAGGAKGYRHE